MTDPTNHTCFQSAIDLAQHLDDGGPRAREIRRCPHCAPLLEQLERWTEELENPDWLVASEAAAAPKLAARLAGLTHAKTLGRIDTDELLHHWGLAQLYLDDSEAHRPRDLERSFRSAEVAVRIVEGIAGGGGALHYDPRRLADLRAKAWAYLATGWRLRRDFARAEEAFSRADAFLVQGTRESRPRIYLLTLRAALLSDQHRDLEAAALLEQAVAGFHGHDSALAYGRVLTQLAAARWQMGEISEAIRRAEESLGVLPCEALRSSTRLDLATYALGAGDLEAAERWLGSLPEDTDGPWRARAVWVAARLARAREQPERAAELLTEARRALAREGLGWEMALASLDLALLELGRGRTGRVREILDEALPLLMTQGAPCEIFAALKLVYQALARDQLTQGLLTEAARRLERIPWWGCRSY